MTDDLSWLALGVDVAMRRTEDGGRSKPLGLAGYEPYQYRANWRLPGVPDGEQVGAPVLCFGSLPVVPGGRTRAVITPFAEHSLPLWQAVAGGDELGMYEGSRLCATASVVWVAPTRSPVADSELERFCVWARGGPAPVVA